MKNVLATILLFVLMSHCTSRGNNPVTIYLIGDSTVANYAVNYGEGQDYYQKKYPKTGWGQVFQEFFTASELNNFKPLIQADSVIVDDRARGGRSTRTFFQEGLWRSVYENLKEGDIVMMQFGHNDASLKNPERYVDIEGYKEFLRLFTTQTFEKKAKPIILTPVARNYPWKDDHLENVHGEYPDAAFEVADELGAYFIDLNKLSMDYFSKKGRDYVSNNYFMNLPPNKYIAYPDGSSDQTHFQPEGARAVAKLVFEAMKVLK
ncbi:rhamnogalacturonan acetylesterase [Winogradskyella forsetii]|uniref:rhamnogalacturonan acetylesterase n=1 Tax=Winogradskyella forsetii TaxID=2686077 RepID=UPI0015BFCB7A|nr:rhamnogalacturonan acetylesterase [Winogradskyella forsetii]